MYGICVEKCWIAEKLVNNPLIMSQGVPIEEEPEWLFEDIESAVNALKNDYMEKLYKVSENNGISCLLCFVVNELGDVVAALDFDGSILMNER